MSGRRVWEPAARLVLGAVLVYAAWLKLRQPWLVFALSIDAYGILPEWGVLGLARTLPWLEMGLGLALQVPGRTLKVAAPAAAGLLGGFFGLMVYTYARGLTIDCGCFGLGDALGPMTLVRDGVLLALAGVVWWRAYRPGDSGAVEAGAGARGVELPS